MRQTHRYVYTYNPLEGVRNDRQYRKESIDEIETCGYQEEVSVSTLEKLKNLPPVSEEYRIMCPFCLNDMYEAGSYHFAKQ